MSEQIAVVASRLKDMQLMHPAQDNGHVCLVCGEPVGLYPSSQRTLRDNPDAVIFCMPCAAGQAKPGDDHVMAPTMDEFLREARESVRRQ